MRAARAHREIRIGFESNRSRDDARSFAYSRSALASCSAAVCVEVRTYCWLARRFARRAARWARRRDALPELDGNTFADAAVAFAARRPPIAFFFFLFFGMPVSKISWGRRALRPVAVSTVNARSVGSSRRAPSSALHAIGHKRRRRTESSGRGGASRSDAPGDRACTKKVARSRMADLAKATKTRAKASKARPPGASRSARSCARRAKSSTRADYGGLSIEHVASRARVEHDTVYRHWPTKADCAKRVSSVSEAAHDLGANHRIGSARSHEMARKMVAFASSFEGPEPRSSSSLDNHFTGRSSRGSRTSLQAGTCEPSHARSYAKRSHAGRSRDVIGAPPRC